MARKMQDRSWEEEVCGDFERVIPNRKLWGSDGAVYQLTGTISRTSCLMGHGCTGVMFLTSVAFLHELATEELMRGELDYLTPRYQVLITVRARKPASGHQECMA